MVGGLVCGKDGAARTKLVTAAEESTAVWASPQHVFLKAYSQTMAIGNFCFGVVMVGHKTAVAYIGYYLYSGCHKYMYK